jgi:S-adenosylmethionine:tRNA ribosyltransferase-isomerase
LAGARPVKGAKTSDYEFELPRELIAQEPLAERAASRLMIVQRDTGRIEHARFGDLAQLVPAGDVLILNTTRVLRARLLGRRASGAPAEILLLAPRGDDVWEAMVSPGGKLKPGRIVEVANELRVEILEVTERRTRLVRLHTPLEVHAAIERFGHVPLPPYIERADAPADAERYQTVYASERGSVAAPTAGLHFTRELLAELEARGVRRAEVVLHVGAGTFRPVEVDDPSQHVMHEERYVVPEETAEAVNDPLRATSGDTRLFIRPPYAFRVVDRMLTNFHLPRSTLIMLVAAFAGYDLTMRAYAEAVRERYRFFSYGDAMVIV